MESSSGVSNEFLSYWEDLKRAVTSFGTVAKSLDRVEEIVQENHALRRKATEAADRITELQSVRDSLTRTFEQRFETWNSERLGLQAQVNQAISRRDHEFSNNERQLKSLETQLLHIKSEVLQGTQALQTMKANLTGTQKKLDDLLSALELIQLDESL
ncbi:hypothetical protein FE257_004927 [Aspergillus nanangensis]|uniref:Uncharacterized protein n=1 Tax=Aspergillus nanangensis TaxID=2582783 RepID=A0AAD4CAI2_ASPNN|nr:hypothetical protein FE257_004927 [Aspergillus nanangensis]